MRWTSPEIRSQIMSQGARWNLSADEQQFLQWFNNNDASNFVASILLLGGVEQPAVDAEVAAISNRLGVSGQSLIAQAIALMTDKIMPQYTQHVAAGGDARVPLPGGGMSSPGGALAVPAPVGPMGVKVSTWTAVLIALGLFLIWRVTK